MNIKITNPKPNIDGKKQYTLFFDPERYTLGELIYSDIMDKSYRCYGTIYYTLSDEIIDIDQMQSVDYNNSTFNTRVYVELNKWADHLLKSVNVYELNNHIDYVVYIDPKNCITKSVTNKETKNNIDPMFASVQMDDDSSKLANDISVKATELLELYNQASASREKSIAITNLETSVMYIKKGLSRYSTTKG